METNVTFSKEINKRSYADIKHEQLQETSSIRFYGEPLDYGSESTFNIKNIKGGFFGIYNWCLCNHDSPDSPCPCRKNTTIWVPVDQLLSMGLDGEKKKYFFDISKDANLQIEQMHPVKASDCIISEITEYSTLNFNRGSINWDSSLQKILEDLLKPTPTLPIPDDDERPGVSEKGIKDTIKKIKIAFEIGYAIGTKADKELDLSDKISDWICKLTGKC